MCEHILIVEDDKGSREYTLENEVYTIGKGVHFDIRIFGQLVSCSQATLVRGSFEDGRYYYQIIDGDLKGKKRKTGLLVNGRNIQVYQLQNEDEIIFSSQVKAKYSKNKVQHCEKDEVIDCCWDIELIDPELLIGQEDE